MPGRPSKPTELILIEGKSHRTKAELDCRKKAEDALRTGETFQESPQVKENRIAHSEFLRLKRLFENISYVDALDQQIINRYCLEVAMSTRLEIMLAGVEQMYDEAKDFEVRLKLNDQVNRLLASIGKNKEMLLKLEDRLFLNPTARMRSVPKTPEKKAEKSGMAAFIEKKRAEQM